MHISELLAGRASAAAAEVFEGLNGLLHGAGRSIKPLDDDDLQLPLGSIGQESPEISAVT